MAYATGNCGFTSGQNLRRKAKNKTPVMEAVWEVLERQPGHGQPAHHPEVASAAVSVVPFQQTSATGSARSCRPPAVPDEYLELFKCTAGQMFERIGKLEIIWRIVAIAQYIEKQCISSNKLVYVTFAKDAGASTVADEWAWQPLEMTHPSNEKRFELALAFKGGESIGLLSVECGTFTTMDESMIVMLHTIGPMLREAVAEVEGMCLGEQPPPRRRSS